jgi:hypothetical protein
MMMPSRFRLRVYIYAARLLLRVLTAVDDWHFRFHHSRTSRYY